MVHSVIKSAFGNSPLNTATLCKDSQISECHQSANSGHRGLPICDWRPGCALIADGFPDKSEVAEAIINSTPHLAEAMVRLGMLYGQTAIDMARALQEGRIWPPADCTCTLQ
jgi:hypothetical protein